MTPAPRGAALVRNLLLFKELEDLLAELAAGPVKPVLLKGAALLATGSADPRHRLMQDIDLLVRPEELAGLMAALKKQGFEKLAGNPSQFRKNELDLDVHTDIWYLEIEEQQLFHERARAVPVGERTARIPAPEDHLIFILAHAAIQHGELEPKWADDIRALIKRYRADIDFPGVWARLTQWGLAPAVAWFLDRSAIYLPGNSSPGNRFHALLLDHFPPINKGHLLQIIFTRSWRFRLRHIKKSFFPDASFLILRYDLKSPAQVFLWRLLRPFLLLCNLIRSAFPVPSY